MSVKKLIFIILPLILFGCSANWHIKRAIQKDNSILEKDTIRFTDSVHVVTEKVSHDSTFLVSKDTVIIKKDKLTIKHYYHNDSVYIYGECDSDTIIEWRTVEIPVQTINYTENWLDKLNRFAMRYGLISFIVIILLVLLRKLYQILYKKIVD